MEEYSNSNKNEKSVSSDGIMDLDCDSTGRQIIHSRKKSSPNVEDGRVRIAARNKDKNSQNYLADTNKNNEKVVSELDELDDFVSELPMEQEPTKPKNKGRKKKKGKKKNKQMNGMNKSPEQRKKMPFHPDKKINEIIKNRFGSLKIKKISNDSDFVDLYMQCYKGYIRYNVDECQWYWYTGKYWKADSEYTVYNFAIKLDYEINRMLKKAI